MCEPGYTCKIDSCKVCEEWVCSGWNECTNGIQSRNCEDSNQCGTNVFKPKTYRDCVIDTGVLVNETIEQPAPVAIITELVLDEKISWHRWYRYLFLLLLLILILLAYFLLRDEEEKESPSIDGLVFEKSNEKTLYVPMAYVHDAIEVLDVLLDMPRKDALKVLKGQYPPIIITLR